MSIYTRTGDDGSTALFGGKRVGKDDPHLIFYGDIDELNSYLGLIASLIQTIELQEFIRSIQKDLMEMSAIAAGSSLGKENFPKRIKEFEERIDMMDGKIPSLHSFVLPGGTKEGSVIHIARSVCRRVEREAVHCSFSIGIPYLNRLSDFLFTLARFVNIQGGREEILWKSDVLQKRKS